MAALNLAHSGLWSGLAFSRRPSLCVGFLRFVGGFAIEGLVASLSAAVINIIIMDWVAIGWSSLAFLVGVARKRALRDRSLLANMGCCSGYV